MSTRFFDFETHGKQILARSGNETQIFSAQIGTATTVPQGWSYADAADNMKIKTASEALSLDYNPYPVYFGKGGRRMYYKTWCNKCHAHPFGSYGIILLTT